MSQAGYLQADTGPSMVKMQPTKTDGSVFHEVTLSGGGAAKKIADSVTLDPDTTAVEWQIQGANVRMRYDGGTPTASQGTKVTNGQGGVMNVTTYGELQVIAEGATDATFVFHEVKRIV